MVTIEEEITQFKKDCSSLIYWRKRRDEAQYKLEEIKVRLQGVSSPRLEGVYIVKDPHKSDKAYWLEEESKWMKERDKWQSRINEIEGKLKQIESDEDRQIIYDLYVYEQNHEKTAKKYHFNSRQSMYDHVKNIIKSLFLQCKPKNVL